MLEYHVVARRIDAPGSVACAKQAEVVLDTNIAGRVDALNPAELFLASIAACMIKGVERVTPMLHFRLRGVEVTLHGVRQDSPPKMISVTYELVVDTDDNRILFSAFGAILQPDLSRREPSSPVLRSFPNCGGAPCAMAQSRPRSQAQRGVEGKTSPDLLLLLDA